MLLGRPPRSLPGRFAAGVLENNIAARVVLHVRGDVVPSAVDTHKHRAARWGRAADDLLDASALWIHAALDPRRRGGG